MQVTILGKKWNLKFVNNLGPNLGTCEDPEYKNRTIRIKRGLSSEVELDALVHEMLHASNWDMYDEKYITKLASDIAKILTKLGYKKNKD